ncbi:MAG: GTP 3',8-cyclase MoaA [Synergistaceae bacterium]|nr:GTP 3',8-cyclase MoaA [Synergistaceae bacterium]
MGEISFQKHLIDRYGRSVDYARISLTDRCNYRCIYCMPEKGVEWVPHSQIISYEEILFLVARMFDIGIRKVRFTGGEPFVRKGLTSFLREVNERIPDMKIALTTNGALLAKYAGEIQNMKLAGINISLDTLDEGKFSEITRGGELSEVLKGIEAVKDFGIPIKLNAVLMKGFNDLEIPDMLNYASNKGLLLRLIEFMPLDNEVWAKDRFISSLEVIDRISKLDSWAPVILNNEPSLPMGPAKYFKNSTTGQCIGIISAVTSHYCENCNRLRINSSGMLRPCLFSNYNLDLRPVLISKDSEELFRIFSSALDMKPEIGVKQGKDEQRHMVQIGG